MRALVGHGESAARTAGNGERETSNSLSMCVCATKREGLCVRDRGVCARVCVSASE